MLPLVLMLVSDPVAPPPDTSTHPEIRLRVLGDPALSRCDGGGFQRVERSAEQPDLLRNDLTHTPGGGEVRRYLLLDRTIRGCPAPISYGLPNSQGGIIRDLAAPSVRPPVRRPSDGQPPRSSE